MLNLKLNTIVGEERKMSNEHKKRIHNPVTGRYYQIRQRSSSKGERGTIMGTWSPPKDDGRKKRHK
jgi:hypothetical protein